MALLVLALQSLAQAREWRITRYDDTIAVLDDGTMVVTEHLTIAFEGSFQGIHRRIPINYPGPRGTNYTLYLDNLKVTGEDNQPLKFDSRRKGAYRVLTIYIPGANDAERKVNITYTVRNGMRFFEDHDELYWNVTGNDWPVPIDSASAYVQFPSNANGLRAQAFTGVYGSHDTDAASKVEGTAVRFQTDTGLPMRGGLTIDVFVPKGVLKQPSALRRAAWFLGANLIILLPLLSFGVMGTLWYLKGRDPDAGVSVAAMYEPPNGFTPAEVGTIIDDRVDPRDVTSTLVDLAVRGYLKIEETNERALFFNNREFIFHLLKPQTEWNELATHEYQILDNMFMTGEQTTTLSSLKNRFYIALPSVRKSILAALKEKGMYNLDPDTANGYRVAGVIAIALPIVAIQALGWYEFFNSIPVAAVAIALSAVIVFIFGKLMTSKTLKGVRALVAVQGFREFMSRVEGDRLRKFPPETFEKYLPFAMALGVEKHWATAFQGIIKDPPSWYVGPTPGYGYGYGFNPIFFTNSMHTMSNSAYEAFTAAPRASSTGSGFGGGGFGGGGFSGGGFGGGGGDAF